MSKQILYSYSTYEQINKGHDRIEKRHVSICKTLDGIRSWPGLTSLIQVKSERQVFTHRMIEVITETRYSLYSLSETAESIASRIRGYWGVENKVHYVRDVTQGEDASRIRTTPLPQIFAIAKRRPVGSLEILQSIYSVTICLKIKKQAQRLCSFGLDTLQQLFRMK